MNSRVKNTLSGRDKTINRRTLFNPAVVLTLVLIGIFSFAALTILSGYAGDLRKSVNGKSTPNSNAATGFASYVQLLESMDYEVKLETKSKPKRNRWSSAPLRIYTLTSTYQSKLLKAIPEDDVQLIILPKWQTLPNIKKSGWVYKVRDRELLRSSRLSGLLNDADMDLDIAQISSNDNTDTYKLKFSDLESYDVDEENDGDDENASTYNYDVHTIKSAIDRLQYFDASEGLEEAEIILKADAQPVLIKLSNSNRYILSEPDLLNTHGIATRKRARLAVNILDVITEYEGLTPQAVDFDLSIHGVGSGVNVIKTMTQPPFLAATLCLLAAGAIIAWQAFSRFGDPRPRLPDFAQGPVSLAKSAAEFMSVSNRVQHMAPDYAELTRQQVIRKLGLIGQSQEHINLAIKARETQRKISPNFAALTAAIDSSHQDTSEITNQTAKPPNLTEHARAMTRWKEEMIS